MSTQEKPIIFNSEMIRTILDGRKSQTRRVIKFGRGIDSDPNHYQFQDMVNGYAYFRYMDCHDEIEIRCPFGVPGDRLWVRETWRVFGWPEDDEVGIQFRADASILWADWPDTSAGEEWYDRIVEQSCADCEKAGLPFDPDYGYRWGMQDEAPTRWRPSIHMPRWASRITLEVVRVWPERIQDITLGDVLKEGCPQDDMEVLLFPQQEFEWFINLWDSFNAKRGYGWDTNP